MGILAEEIILRIKEAELLYFRLIIVAAPSGSGKSKALRDVAQEIASTVINVNLELSKRMLDLTERQRALQVADILNKIVDEKGDGIAILDNIEILFNVSLQQDPLRLLQQLSRKRVIIAAWNGDVEKNSLTYASPEHPEFRRYPVDETVIVASGKPGS